MTEDRIPKPSEESTAAAASGRQRKKRKWDQPAESLMAAGLSIAGAHPIGMAGINGVPFPGAIPLSTALLANQIPENSSAACLLFQSPSVSQSAATMVQKLNQPKIQDELIAREIIINDAEPTVRYKLTKRQTQEEIQKATGAVVITRGKYRPPNELPDSEKPLYLHISSGANLDTAERIKAVDRAASMVEEILKQGQIPLSAPDPLTSAMTNGQATQPLNTSLFLGFETDPLLNIAARIRGPNDQYVNHIMNETGATVVLRGRGSGNLDNSNTEEAKQPLHLYLSSTNPKSLEAARVLAENLLDTICTECCASRISSGKVYSAVPPPHQLLAGVESSGEVPSVKASPIYGSLLHSGSLPNYGNTQQHATTYSHSSVTRGTCYSGYGGIYPQATALQQVALALRKAPASATPLLASSNSPVSTMVKSNSNSSVETETRLPQRRKFQELPASNGIMAHHQNSLQGSECIKPGLEDSFLRNISSMPPPKKSVRSGSDATTPPTNMPPPPPKLVAPKRPEQTQNGHVPVTKKSNDEPVSDTLLKLLEYGDEDDDNDTLGEEGPIESGTAQNFSSKPFWAV